MTDYQNFSAHEILHTYVHLTNNIKLMYTLFSIRRQKVGIKLLKIKETYKQKRVIEYIENSRKK